LSRANAGEVDPVETISFPTSAAEKAVPGYISRDGERFAFAVPVAPPRKEVTPRPEILARYTGTYVLDGRDVVLSLEGTRLMLQAGGRKAMLFAESESRFFLKATNGEIEFFRDDQGNPLYFFIYRGGAPRLATRK
jgi:hypothetical protein